MKTKDPTCEFKDSTLTFALSAYARGCLLSVASSISLTVTFRRIVHSKREYLYSLFLQGVITLVRDSVPSCTASAETPTYMNK